MSLAICIPVGPDSTIDTLDLTLVTIASQIDAEIEVIVKTLGTHLEPDIRAAYSRLGLKGILLTGMDKGIYDAFNKCAEVSTSDWILFLGCGDELASQNVASNIHTVAKNCKDLALYGQVLIVDDPMSPPREFDNSVFFRKRRITPWRNPCHSQGLVYRRAWIADHPFRLDLGPLADLVHTHHYHVFEQAHWIGQPVAVFKMGGVSNSPTIGSCKNRLLGVLENCNHFTPRSFYQILSILFVSLHFIYTYLFSFRPKRSTPNLKTV